MKKTIIIAALSAGLLTGCGEALAPTTTGAGAPAAQVACLNTTTLSAEGSRVVDDYTRASDASFAGDIGGAASYTRQAADDIHAMALDSAADPTVAADLRAAELNTRRAADLIEAGDLLGATAAINAATGNITDATTDLENTTAEVC